MDAEEAASHQRWRRPANGLASLLVLFLLAGLKLGGVVTWSWWAVTAPLWIPVLALIAIALPLAGSALTSRLGDWRQDRKYQRLDRPARWIGPGSQDA